jgi:hypothetical protein
MQSFKSFDQMVAEKFNIKQLQMVLKRTIDRDSASTHRAKEIKNFLLGMMVYR